MDLEISSRSPSSSPVYHLGVNGIPPNYSDEVGAFDITNEIDYENEFQNGMTTINESFSHSNDEDVRFNGSLDKSLSTFSKDESDKNSVKKAKRIASPTQPKIYEKKTSSSLLRDSILRNSFSNKSIGNLRTNSSHRLLSRNNSGFSNLSNSIPNSTNANNTNIHFPSIRPQTASSVYHDLPQDQLQRQFLKDQATMKEVHKHINTECSAVINNRHTINWINKHRPQHMQNKVNIQIMPMIAIQMKAIFDTFDFNHSGEIDYQELLDAIKLVIAHNEKVANNANNGIISSDHLENYNSNANHSDNRKNIIDNFNDNNSSNDSSIPSKTYSYTKEDLQAIEDFFLEMDTNHNGAVDFVEFLTSMLSEDDTTVTNNNHHHKPKGNKSINSTANTNTNSNHNLSSTTTSKLLNLSTGKLSHAHGTYFNPKELYEEYTRHCLSNPHLQYIDPEQATTTYQQKKMRLRLLFEHFANELRRKQFLQRMDDEKLTDVQRLRTMKQLLTMPYIFDTADINKQYIDQRVHQYHQSVLNAIEQTCLTSNLSKQQSVPTKPHLISLPVTASQKSRATAVSINNTGNIMQVMNLTGSAYCGLFIQKTPTVPTIATTSLPEQGNIQSETNTSNLDISQSGQSDFANKLQTQRQQQQQQQKQQKQQMELLSCNNPAPEKKKLHAERLRQAAAIIKQQRSTNSNNSGNNYNSSNTNNSSNSIYKSYKQHDESQQLSTFDEEMDELLTTIKYTPSERTLFQNQQLSPSHNSSTTTTTTHGLPTINMQHLGRQSTSTTLFTLPSQGIDQTAYTPTALQTARHFASGKKGLYSDEFLPATNISSSNNVNNNHSNNSHHPFLRQKTANKRL